MTSAIGLQHEEDQGAADRLHLGAAGRREEVIGFREARIALDGLFRLDDAGVERLSATLDGGIDERDRVYLRYEHYQPDREAISFRDRFYELYARGMQSLLRAGWARTEAQSNWLTEARLLKREGRDPGFGIALERTGPWSEGTSLQVRFDAVSFNDESAVSVYGTLGRPLSAQWLLSVGAVAQRHSTLLLGDNDTVGAEFRLKRMLAADLFVDLFGEHLFHSQLEDEYVGGVRLTWLFSEAGS